MNFSSQCHSCNFAPGTLSNSSSLLSFTADDLAHALFATGRAPGDQAVHGASSVYEWLHRVAIIPAYLRRSPGGALTRSPLAVDLDRSEKVGVSYALGQAITSVFCQQRLGVTHLLHVDRYSRRFNATFAVGTKQRPDLFGPGRGGWVVAEAKGRSNSMEAALRGKLISQKRSIRTVNGAPPWVAVGCVASFPSPSKTLRVDAFDPDEAEPEAIAIDASLGRFLLAYYEPFVRALDQGVPDDGSDDAVEIVRLPGAGLRFGLLRGIADAVRANQSPESTQLPDALYNALDRGPNDSFADDLFTDGSFVRGDWDASFLLQREPTL